jgi:hypothetical protein
MSNDLKAKQDKLAAKQLEIDADRLAIRVEIEAKAAPIRAEREKISLEIIKLQERQHELSKTLRELETIDGPQHPGSLKFGVRPAPKKD